MSEIKNILHVFSTFEVGGAQRRFASYLAGSSANFNHQIYAMDVCYDALELVEDVSILGARKQLVPKGNTLAALRACRKLLKKHKPDLLVTYNWGATEWALANSLFPICPTIHIQDGFGVEEQTTEITSRRLMRGIAYRRCAKVIVPSRTLQKQASKGWHIAAKKLLFIPNGIDTDRFSRAPNPDMVQAYGLNTSGKTIGTIAGLRPEKNIGRLIEAFSLVEDEHPGSQLVIVGDGIGTDALKMLAGRVCAKKSVIFTGNMKAPESILPAFDIFALSSNTEQMPLSVLEAMAAGKPIVSTNVGDIKEMVSDSNKPYIEEISAKTLAVKLSSLLGDPETIKTIGAENKAKAAQCYGLEKMVKTYDKIFNDPYA